MIILNMLAGEEAPIGYHKFVSASVNERDIFTAGRKSYPPEEDGRVVVTSSACLPTDGQEARDIVEAYLESLDWLSK